MGTTNERAASVRGADGSIGLTHEEPEYVTTTPLALAIAATWISWFVLPVLIGGGL